MLITEANMKYNYKMNKTKFCLKKKSKLVLANCLITAVKGSRECSYWEINFRLTPTGQLFSYNTSHAFLLTQINVL